ncbi:MAG: zinc ribbon domain-containing protein [Alphaproteobacteria bacterium]|nr:zinc ribbon domain-containing protein [Alphaproteobacteria bacterium]
MDGSARPPLPRPGRPRATLGRGACGRTLDWRRRSPDRDQAIPGAGRRQRWSSHRWRACQRAEYRAAGARIHASPDTRFLLLQRSHQSPPGPVAVDRCPGHRHRGGADWTCGGLGIGLAGCWGAGVAIPHAPPTTKRPPTTAASRPREARVRSSSFQRCGASNIGAQGRCLLCDAPLPAPSATCDRCGAELRPGARYCVTCGAAVAQVPAGTPRREPGTCPACGAALRPGTRFCTRCGHGVAA